MNFVLNGLRTCVKRQDKKTKHKWSPIQVSCHQSQKDLEVKTGQPAQTWQWLMADGKGTLTAVSVRNLAVGIGSKEHVLPYAAVQILTEHVISAGTHPSWQIFVAWAPHVLEVSDAIHWWLGKP